MTNEEIQSKMNFIIEHQAQFAADIQMLKEAHTRGEERITKIENVILRLANVMENNFAMLSTAQAKADERIAILSERMVALADSQTLTDHRMDALIDIIRRERNGEKES